MSGLLRIFAVGVIERNIVGQGTKHREVEQKSPS